MRVAPLLPLVCSFFSGAASAPLERAVWKREAFDPAGRPLWTDSVYFDTAGKPLFERRRDAAGSLHSIVRIHYDAQGHEVERIRKDTADSAIETASCLYRMLPEGPAFREWGRSDSAYAYLRLGVLAPPAQDTVFSLRGDEILFAFRDGRLARAGRSNHGEASTVADFRYDSLGRHASTRFSRRGGGRLGRDTVLRDFAGRQTGWILEDARGRPVRREARELAPDGRLLEHRAWAGSDTGATVVRHSWARRDSLPRAEGVRSRFAGAAAGRPCSPDWRDMIPFAIAPASLEGLRLAPGRSMRPERGPDPDGLFPEPFVIEDSCHIHEEPAAIATCHERADLRRKADYFGPLSRCLAAPAGACADTLVAAAGRLVDSVDTPELPERALDSVAGILIGKGPPDAERRLIDAARGTGKCESLRERLLVMLLRARTERGYEAFIAAGGNGDLPAFPRGEDRADTAVAGPALAAAWEYRRRVLALEPALPPPAVGRETGHDRRGAAMAVAEWLRDGDPSRLPEAERMAYGPDDREGEGSPDGLAEWARLAEALEGRRLGAVLRRTPDPGLIRRILASRGLDWERYLLGYLADPWNLEWRPYYQAWLARHGSIASAEALVAMPPHPFAPDGYDLGYTLALGALAAAPGARPDIPASFLPHAPGHTAAFRRDPAAGPLPPRLRARALARLLAPLDENPLHAPAREILSVLSLEDVPGRAGYAAKAAAIPDQGIRDSALALMERSHPPGGPPFRPPAGLIPLDPVRIRLVSGGIPLARLPLQARGASVPLEPREGRPGSWRRAETDQDGYFSFGRMEFARMIRGSWELEIVSRPDRDSRPDARSPRFSARTPIGDWPAGTVTVEVPLRKVTIVPALPAGFRPAQESSVRLKVHSAASGDDEGPVFLPWRDSLVLAAWGDGEYRISIAIPGLRTEILPPFRVAGGDARIAPVLRRGADATVIVDAPAGQNPERILGVTLLDAEGMERWPSDREQYVYGGMGSLAGEPIRFAGLAPGAYVLKVMGSHAFRPLYEASRNPGPPYSSRLRTAPPRSRPHRENVKELRYPFRVPANGPDDMDLGRLRLVADAPGDAPAPVTGAARSRGVTASPARKAPSGR